MLSIKTADRRAEREDVTSFLADLRLSRSRAESGNKPCVACQIILRLADDGWKETFYEPPTAQERILGYIKEHGAASSSDLAAALPIVPGHIKTLLGKMYKAGDLGREKVYPKPKGGQPYRYFMKTD